MDEQTQRRTATAPQTSTYPRLIKIAEAAEILNLGKTKTYGMVRAGVLPSLRMGGSVRVPYDGLMEWIKQNTTGG